MMPRVLYVSYDGVLEPLGESQVVNYIERLADGADIALISFEKPEDAADQTRMEAMRSRLRACTIEWVPLPYHKRPPVLSTAFDVFRGIAAGRRLARARSVNILHARGYVPSLIALGVRRMCPRAKFLFDMRGFWVDEKIEAGHWPRESALVRVARWWERRFYASADAVVSLTAAGARAIPELGVSMRADAPVEVIPTCADLARFSPAEKDAALAASLGLRAGPVIGCVGTMGNWYLQQEMLDALAVLTQKLPDLQVLLVTRDDHAALRRDLLSAGVPAERLVLTSANFADMPRYIRLFDAGLFFIKPTFAKRASAATKLAEFLGCGVPVLINGGVGDSGTIVHANGVGIVLDTLNRDTFAGAAAPLAEMIRDASYRSRCRSTAAEIFDLDQGVVRYRELYRRLLTN